MVPLRSSASGAPRFYSDVPSDETTPLLPFSFQEDRFFSRSPAPAVLSRPSVGPSTSVESSKTQPQKPPVFNYGWGYRCKQWTSNMSVATGVGFVVLMAVLPEPFVTKAIAIAVGLVMVAAGLIAKHQLYKKAFQHEALESTIASLQQQVIVLRTDIAELDTTKKELSVQVQALRAEIDRLKAVVADLDTRIRKGLEQLNKEREENNRIRARLLAKIEEADEHEKTNEERTLKLHQEEDRLKTIEKELEQRQMQLVRDREALAKSQADLVALQQQILRQAALSQTKK